MEHNFFLYIYFFVIYLLVFLYQILYFLFYFQLFLSYAISNKIKFSFLIIFFGKLPLPGTESEMERMTDFKKFVLQSYTLELTKPS